MPDALDREQVSKWIERWRVVNQAQDDLVRSQGAPDPGVALEAGLGFIAFMAHVAAGSELATQERRAGEESVRRAWTRLKAPYVR